ncbi:3-ketoacyl-CoA synthase 1 [Apostasia shenzhenica]|uniref:3-ketoacyl-CoA synthase 1 n=1 Tax=Apostasia shenzhenica TaxID=1088818 RepID=A0A2I0A5X7_9ASPA|nr:3-ketoacyl-CoA synthase 1 [Apostasia shenzhenica]
MPHTPPAYQTEDAAGNIGFALRKNLVRVACEALAAHVRILAPRVLPWTDLARYAYRLAVAGKPSHVPDFAAAFEHMCMHTRGKAVDRRRRTCHAVRVPGH